ncbi:DUF262 domain-containing protein [Corynebacterium sanguinis]|uniref:DUF262 domain-containing protein n=1 Tax=Corynebacterium sanguinis TaxID=2594913 RepID=UPI001186E9ED|nr:DUF262 domain-containing protein [Corynebacterium sanguinis]QDR77346.1 DUF262 domain-containing protein [Corynebacterium sanguinis]
MEADTKPLKRIMSVEGRYVIPTFQRDYEWTKDGQWELLFEDLDSLAGRLGSARAEAEATGSSRARAEESVAPHFLGAVVCDQLPSPTGGLTLSAVIDGQQRLTTLQLLLRGVLDVLQETGSSRLRQVKRLLENPEDVIDHDHERYKLWPRRKDRDVWPVAMSDTVPAYGPEDHLYLQARQYFADSVRNALVDDHGRDRTDDFVDALLDLFKLVVIDLDDNDDAQVIFEVLNGRQTPLSASDLVKNLLFLRGELADEQELDELYDAYWAEFDEPWWKGKIGVGHAARARRDVLLSVWLTAASGKEANVGHLYGEIRQFLAGGNYKTKDILMELSEYRQAYKAIYGVADAGSTRLAQSYRNLVALKLLTAVPLLAWMRTLPASRLSLADHEKAVGAVESWVVRRMMRGDNTRGYGAAFQGVLKNAQAAACDPEADIAATVVATLMASPNSLAWPSDAEITSAFTQDRFYDRFTQERIRLILGAIDMQMRSENPKTEPAVFDYSRLQIEHLMPQSWKTHWPLPSSVNENSARRDLATAERALAVDRIGNLTLVTSAFNQGVSNLGWEQKRPELAAQSALQLNIPIAAAQHWDEATITARGADLAEIVCRIWPR